MTITRAIKIAKQQIAKNEEFIECVKEEDRKKPDHTKEQLGHKIYHIVITMAEGEVKTLKQIIKQLQIKRKKSSKK